MRILVVDDEPNVVKSLVRTLRAFGYDVDGVESSHQALAQVQAENWGKNPYDAILLDFNMPDMTGVELVRQMVATGAHVIMHTAVNDLPIVRACAFLGVKWWLLKPSSPNEIMIALCFVPDDEGKIGIG